MSRGLGIQGLGVLECRARNSGLSFLGIKSYESKEFRFYEFRV